jgi:hypothetical protein
MSDEVIALIEMDLPFPLSFGDRETLLMILLNRTSFERSRFPSSPMPQFVRFSFVRHLREKDTNPIRNSSIGDIV